MNKQDSVPISNWKEVERRLEAISNKNKRGVDGKNGASAYEIWLDEGNTGTIQDFLDSLKGQDGTNGTNGVDGKSAYQIWLDEGNTGTVQDFLNSLKGKNGTNGTNGVDGKSAYQIWLDEGHTGTEQDFLNSLKGQDGANGYTPVKGTDYFTNTEIDQFVGEARKTINITTANTNLNDYTTNGKYHFKSNVTPVNIPAGVDGWLEVLTSDYGKTKQIWYREGTANSNDSETYVRTYTSGQWSNWTKYTTNKVIRTTLNVSDNYFSTIDVNELLKNGQTVQVNFRGKLSKNVPGNTTFLRGLYSNIIGSAYTNVLYIGGQYSVSKPVWFYTTMSGEIKGPSSSDGLTAGTWVHISFMYLTES